MAPQLNAAQHILIKALLKEGFETKLIATEASCSVHAVQRIRLKRQQPEMPTTPRTNRVGRRRYIMPSMQKALYDILIEQPYLYRCEMADFLYTCPIPLRSIPVLLRSCNADTSRDMMIEQGLNLVDLPALLKDSFANVVIQT
jgi:hypothetical protein